MQQYIASTTTHHYVLQMTNKKIEKEKRETPIKERKKMPKTSNLTIKQKKKKRNHRGESYST